MYHKKKPKWQSKHLQKEYIPLWIDELVYKPMKLEREKERMAKQKIEIKEMLDTGFLTADEYDKSLKRIVEQESVLSEGKYM